MTFADRRAVLKRRTRAVKVMMNQTSMQSIGRLDTLDRLETEATMYDEFATEAGRETVADRGKEDWFHPSEGVEFEYEGYCEWDDGCLFGECNCLGECVGSFQVGVSRFSVDYDGGDEHRSYIACSGVAYIIQDSCNRDNGRKMMG